MRVLVKVEEKSDNASIMSEKKSPGGMNSRSTFGANNETSFKSISFA
jgi:hypothetical protein